MTALDYQYNATVLRWIDGDTVDLTVDVGFHLTFTDRFRLIGCDTPERGKPGAAEAKARVNELAPVDTRVIVRTTKGDKYGRWLANVFAPSGDVGTTLIAESLAKPYFGGTKDAS